MDFAKFNDTLKLFKSVVVDDQKQNESSFKENYRIIIHLWNRGIVLDEKIYQTFNEDALDTIATLAAGLYGFNATKMNSTFWKRYEDVEWSSEEYLKLIQAIHYQSTYGQEIVGKKGVGFEPESLHGVDIEVLKELTYISAITKEELQDKVDNMVTSGIALKGNTIDLLESIISDYSLTVDPNKIKNKELMCHICLTNHIVPKDFSEFTRLMLFATTNSTLLIQSKDKIHEILANTASYANDYNWLRLYIEKYGFYNFANHISRYRRIYLAYRANAPKDIKKLINKAFKKSKIFHVAMKKQPLERINDKTISLNQIERAIDNKPTIFKLIKVLSAMQNSDSGNKLYRIRNGKSYLKLDSVLKYDYVPVKDIQRSTDISHFINRALIERLGSWDNKVFYIPKGIHYTVPTSEKQFIGDIPYLTTIDVPYNNASIGVAWEKECDLDLHAISSTGAHIGWDASLNNYDLTHSGDMTHTNQYGYAAEFLKVESHDSLSPFTIYLTNFRNGEVNDIKKRLR